MKKITIALIMVISLIAPIQTMAESVTQNGTIIEPLEQNIEQIIDEITSEPRPINSDAIQNVKEYISKYGRDIKLEEISKELRISKEEIAMVMDSTRPVDSIENAKYKDNKTDKTISILEQISTGKDEQSEIVNKIAIKNLIGELEDNEKEIILLRYYKQKTQMQVSKILGITQVQVSRIERKVLEKMKRKLIS